jgi:histidine triad (HIT) family protein
MENIQEIKKSEECPFCLIISEKIKTFKIYEDNKVVVILDINPASIGHMLVIPRKHYSLFSQISDQDLAHIFITISRLTQLVKKSLNSEGVNLFIAEGEIAGQRVDHCLIHIIPRFKDDGLNFTWQPKKMKEEDLAQLQSLLLKNIQLVKQVQAQQEVQKEKPKEITKEELKSYEEEIVKPEERLP